MTTSTSTAATVSGKNKLICFNPDCKELKIDRLRKGWKLRTGDFAQLCDRCSSVFEEDRFCELFHTNAAGWRSCGTCRKPLHCGCIVSMHSFALLDAGGVECTACFRKHSFMASNQSWSHVPSSLSERFNDISTKCWNSVAIPNGVSGQWWHSANARNIVTSQSELYPRMPYEVDRLNGANKLISAERSPVFGLERVLGDPSERPVPSSLDLSVHDRLSNQNAGADTVVALNAFRREESNLGVSQDACHLPGQNGSMDARKGVIPESGLNTPVAGMSIDAHSNSHVNIMLQSSSAKYPLVPQQGTVVPYTPNETNGSTSVSGTQPQRQTPPPLLSKQLHADSQNGVDSSAETQMSNGKGRGDTRGRNQLLPRYWPKITDQELQQISGDSNAVITPLFEKILSASDAGRIGRLVLPKKCAEAYFPTISQPEGVPLRVQDAKGMEWVFQFRFWPNNNSRMYVLEGVTPCIQNMQLQAGDTVTFSRRDPDGKLVMGFRKTSNTPPANQDHRKPKIGNSVSKHAEANLKEANTWSEVDKAGYIAKDAVRDKSYPVPSKRKNSALGLKSKRLQIENEDLIELQLTWEEAQGLLRPSANHDSIVCVVEGQHFEEYEEAPVLGKPNIFTTTNLGENIQWAQCEECLKWRKLPVHAHLPSKWTCSDNSWDPKRSSCSSDPELTDDQLQDLLNSINSVASKENNSAKGSDRVERSEGLDTLANLAILGEVEVLPSSTQPPTTKHPRHRPGCSCIVCIQPPSGKGQKHRDTCTCNVCMTVRRRFRTLMERRAKRPPENEAGTSRKKQQKSEKPERVDNLQPSSNTHSGLNQEMTVHVNAAGDCNHRNPPSPFKGGIDLNIQPEREDESSSLSGSGSIMKSVRDPLALYHKKQKLAGSFKNKGPDQLTNRGGNEVGAENLVNDVSHSYDIEDGDRDPPDPLSAWVPDTSATG